MVPEFRVMPPRAVLDTNIVVSALLFGRGRLAWLRHAWQGSRFVPLIDHDTTNELVRALGYPKFQLKESEQKALLAEFLPFAEVVPHHGKQVNLPKVRDPADRKFLALARRAGADAHIIGDADLHAIRSKSWRIPIPTPAEFCDWLGQRAENTKGAH